MFVTQLGNVTLYSTFPQSLAWANSLKISSTQNVTGRATEQYLYPSDSPILLSIAPFLGQQTGPLKAQSARADIMAFAAAKRPIY